MKILLISVGVLTVLLAAVIGGCWLASRGDDPDKPGENDPPGITMGDMEQDPSTEEPDTVTEGPSEETTVPEKSDPEPTTEATDPTQPDPVKPTEPDITEPTRPVPSEPDTGGSTNTTVPNQGDLVCERVAVFSGRFVEDGSDIPVENVAAILVTNRSDEFLDLANISYDIDGKTGTFVVTGLPAGRSAWVMEYTGMTVNSESSIQYQGCNTSFRKDVVASAEEITIQHDGNMLLATNNTDRTLENVFIYYKSVHTDGNYFGGITYMVEFGTLEPGASVEKLGGHFSPEESEIVRIGWQESQTDEAS